MSMDQHLAEIYGTPGGSPQTEDLEKQAEAELFCKLAADNGINLDELTDEQVAELYNTTFSKEAMDDEGGPPGASASGGEEKCKDCNKSPCTCKKDEGEEKESAARAEFLVKKAQQEKWAEADRMGRIMAHAYVQELGLIGEQLEKGASADSVKARAAELSKKASKNEQPKAEPVKTINKTASAIDELAVAHAVKLAAANSWDEKEASARVHAVFTLGLAETEKIASAQTVDQAVETRALEYLEAAGYPVTWQSE